CPILRASGMGSSHAAKGEGRCHRFCEVTGNAAVESSPAAWLDIHGLPNKSRSAVLIPHLGGFCSGKGYWFLQRKVIQQRRWINRYPFTYLLQQNTLARIIQKARVVPWGTLCQPQQKAQQNVLQTRDSSHTNSPNQRANQQTVQDIRHEFVLVPS